MIIRLLNIIKRFAVLWFNLSLQIFISDVQLRCVYGLMSSFVTPLKHFALRLKYGGYSGVKIYALGILIRFMACSFSSSSPDFAPRTDSVLRWLQTVSGRA